MVAQANALRVYLGAQWPYHRTARSCSACDRHFAKLCSSEIGRICFGLRQYARLKVHAEVGVSGLEMGRAKEHISMPAASCIFPHLHVGSTSTNPRLAHPQSLSFIIAGGLSQCCMCTKRKRQGPNFVTIHLVLIALGGDVSRDEINRRTRRGSTESNASPRSVIRGPQCRSASETWG